MFTVFIYVVYVSQIHYITSNINDTPILSNLDIEPQIPRVT